MPMRTFVRVIVRQRVTIRAKQLQTSYANFTATEAWNESVLNEVSTKRFADKLKRFACECRAR